MAGLRIAVDLRGLPGPDEPPRGPARWARRVAGLALAEAGEHEVRLVERGSPPAPADVVVSLGPSTRPPGGHVPTVSAVYDLSHLLTRRAQPWLERRRRSWQSALLARRSDGLLAPSRSIAYALVTYLRVPDAAVTWLPAIGPGWQRPPQAAVEALRAELHLKPQYLLFVGTISRRKNLHTLLGAWDRLWPEVGDRAELIVAGAVEHGAPPSLLSEVIAGGARYLGPVEDARLPALLAGATAFVTPSRAEGCSIGAIEAMTAGTPPLVAENTALAEVVGDAGRVLPTEDADAWAAAMRAILDDRRQRGLMSARGLRAAGDLREEDAGRRLIAAAERAVRGSRPAAAAAASES